MGCVPNKKASQTSTKNSRIKIPETPAPRRQSFYEQFNNGFDSQEHGNYLTASRIAGDLEQQTKQNTYLNSLPRSQNYLRTSNSSITLESQSHPPMPPVMNGNYGSMFENQQNTMKTSINKQYQSPQKYENQRTNQMFQSPNKSNFNQVSQIQTSNFPNVYNQNLRPQSPRIEQQRFQIPRVNTPPPINQTYVSPPYPNQQQISPQHNFINNATLNSPRQMMTNHYLNSNQNQAPTMNTQQQMQQQIRLQMQQMQQIQQMQQQQIFQQKQMQQMMMPLNQHMPNQIPVNIRSNSPTSSFQKPNLTSNKNNQQYLRQLMKQTSTNDEGFRGIYVQRMNFGTKV